MVLYNSHEFNSIAVQGYIHLTTNDHCFLNHITFFTSYEANTYLALLNTSLPSVYSLSYYYY
jgi:hypothetical protein